MKAILSTRTTSSDTSGWHLHWASPLEDFESPVRIRSPLSMWQTGIALLHRPNGAGQQLDLQFQGPEASEALNFVIKDNSTGRWYDCNGDNFHVPLSLDYEQQAEAAKSSPKEEKAAEPPLRDEQLPQLPDELCGIWAYITWEAAGCPNRSQEESSREYQNAIKVGPAPAASSSCQMWPPQLESKERRS